MVRASPESWILQSGNGGDINRRRACNGPWCSTHEDCWHLRISGETFRKVPVLIKGIIPLLVMFDFFRHSRTNIDRLPKYIVITIEILPEISTCYLKLKYPIILSSLEEYVLAHQNPTGMLGIEALH